MMTCTSDKSGKASTGVLRSAQTPQAAIISVASSTSKRLAIDQRISRAIMAGLQEGLADGLGGVGLQLSRTTQLIAGSGGTAAAGINGTSGQGANNAAVLDAIERLIQLMSGPLKITGGSLLSDLMTARYQIEKEMA